MIYRGRWALVTGASWGVGEAFARALAARGTHLLMVARGEDRLRSLAGTISAAHAIRVETVALDLAEPDGPARLQAAADAMGIEPDLLVNNAGLGVLGPFRDSPVERQLAMVRLNVSALVALTHLYLPRMIARRSGAVLNVASASAFQPLPNYAVYAASKAFVLRFSEALWAECRPAGVRIVAVCPGAVEAAPFDGVERRALGRRVTRQQVAERALAALDRDAPTIIPSPISHLTRVAANVVPRPLQLVVTEKLIRRFPLMFTGERKRQA